MPAVRVIGSDGEEHLGGAALVHGFVAFGGLFQGQGEIEHLAGQHHAQCLLLLVGYN